MAGGRPSDYSAEIAGVICQRMSEGESLRRICADETMPNKTTVLRWLTIHTEFRTQYTIAREFQADHFGDEIIEIADDGTNDYVTKENKDGATYEAVDTEHINRSRLRVDTRKWLMARMAPKKYGDKVVQEHTGPDGGPVQIQRIERVIVDPQPTDSNGEGVPAAS